MATSFPSLEQLSKPQTLDVNEIAPPAIAQPPAQRSVPTQPSIDNPVIPKPLSNLAAQGSNISTMGQILAWVAAAKGDFRGLQAIEENKRMTALGKSLHPQMLKINELTNSGKWEDAGKLSDEIVGQYGPAAKELIPYMQQMREDIRGKIKGWNALKGVVARAEEVIKPNDIRYPAFKALKNAVERRDYISETQAFNEADRLKTDIQIIGNRAYVKTPTSSDVQTYGLPESVKGSDVNNFMGLTLAGQYNLPSGEHLASILNDVAVKDASGTTITPGSPEAMKIKQDYAKLLPVQAQIDVMKSIPLDPATAYQMLLELGPMKTLLRDIPSDRGESIKQAVARTLGMQEEERLKAGLRTDPYKADTADRVNVDFSPQSPTFLRELAPSEYTKVQQSGGAIGQIRREVYDKEVKPNLASIEALNLIPTMLQGNTLTTRSSQLQGWVNDTLSSYLRYPVTAQSEIRQNARAIFAEAINRAEGTISREEVAKLREFASNPFTTNAQLIDMAKNFKERLSMVIYRSIGGYMQPGAPIEPALPPTVRGQAPVQPQRQPYTRGAGKPTSTISPELDRQLQEAEAAARRGEVAPNTTVIPPGGAAQPTPTAPAAQPTGKTAEERVKEAWQKRKQVK